MREQVHRLLEKNNQPLTSRPAIAMDVKIFFSFSQQVMCSQKIMHD